MNKGTISVEFYVGRYIYLSELLSTIPDVRFGGRGSRESISVYTVNNKTGQRDRLRITNTSPKWDHYYELAVRRERVKEQLNLLLSSWSEDYKGSLAKISSEYIIIPNDVNRYDCDCWNLFKSNDCDVQNKYPVRYKDFVMRSYFEVEVAKVLDSLGIDYKYEVRLPIGGGDEISPDMAVNLPEYNRCGFVEALGGLDSLKYVSHNTWKLKGYINCGLYPNRDVALVSADSKVVPTRDMIKRMIGTMLSYIASQYVMKKSLFNSVCVDSYVDSF